jgi:hypothetical protein
MMNPQLKDILERLADWPKEDQEELALYALEIEVRRQGAYHASSDELGSIDEALHSVADGQIATENEVNEVVSKFCKP